MEDRCKRIADRRYSKPSAYKSGAIVRCRKGNIWKGIKEGKYDNKGKGGQFTLVKENPFDIKKLVDKKILFVTKPGDGKGGVDEPNWEGDASVITLYNMAKAEPWMKLAVKSPMPQAIPYIQNNQDKVIYNGKYNQILWGIKKMGLKPEDFYLNKSEAFFIGEDEPELKDIQYNKPNFEHEWEEAMRYPEFREMGKEKWISLGNKGYVTNYSDIEDSLGNVDLDFDSLEDNKKLRFKKAYKSGVIEHPIAVKFNNDTYDLVAGNTRLSGLVELGIDPKIWIVDLSYLNEAKKETLRTWFKRKGAAGKVGGWVDCNTCREVDGKTKCKPCGRQKGEKRAKYPSCRPTPSACKQPGKIGRAHV